MTNFHLPLFRALTYREGTGSFPDTLLEGLWCLPEEEKSDIRQCLASKLDFVMERYSIQRPKYFFH